MFSRAGFTEAARAEAESVGAQLIDLNRLDADLNQLDADLREAFESDR